VKKQPSKFRSVVDRIFSALMGQSRLSATLGVYVCIACMLLLYVSSQVYTGMLRQDIAEMKRRQSQQRETINALTSTYMGLSSRAAVAHYCEQQLGMVASDEGRMERFAVDEAIHDFVEPIEFTENYSAAPDAYRFSLRRVSETR